MDRAPSKRYQTYLDATVTDMTDQDRVASGKIVDVSEAGVWANLSLRFDAGASVKMQLGDCELFGLVTSCADGKWYRTGIDIQRAVIGDSDLARLVNAVLADTMPNTPGVTVNIPA